MENSNVLVHERNIDFCYIWLVSVKISLNIAFPL